MRGFSKIFRFKKSCSLIASNATLIELIKSCSTYQIVSSTTNFNICLNSYIRQVSTKVQPRISWETSSYETLLKKLEIVLENESIDEVWEAFNNYKRLHGFPNAQLVNNLIVNLSYSAEHVWLHKAYDLVLVVLNEKPHLLYHNSLIRLALMLARAQIPILASTVLRVILDKFKLPSIDTWNILFSHLVKTQIGSYLASEILIEICEYCMDHKLNRKSSRQKIKLMTPSSIMFNLVLNSCFLHGSMLKAQQIIELMPDVGVVADANTIVIIARIYEIIGQRDELKNLQEHIDVVSSASLKRHYQKFYDSLLSLHFKFNDLDAAAELVLELYRQPKSSERRSGLQKHCLFQIGSSNLTTGSKILVDHKKLPTDLVMETQNLQELVLFMDGKYVPTYKVFAKLLNGFVKNQKVNNLSNLLIKIQKETDSKEASLCSDVIDSCVQLGWLETAHDILDDLEAAAIPVGAATYKSLLKAYCKENMLDEFSILERQMKEAGHLVNLSHDDSALNQNSTLVEHLDRVILEEDTSSSLIYEFNTSILFFCKAKMMEDALKTFKRMQEMSIKPTVKTFGHIVNGYSSLHMYRQITIFWGEIGRRLEDRTLVADRDLMDILLCNFLRGGYFERVMEVVNYMLKHDMFTDKLKYKREFLKLHKDLYRSLKTSDTRTDAQSKRLEHVRAFKKWAGIHDKI